MTREKLEKYFEKYYSLCYRVAFTQVKAHADAEDVAQEVFMRLLRYQPKFACLEHEKAWMIRAALNLSRDFIKSKWRSATVGLDAVAEAEKSYFHVPHLREYETLWMILQLPERYRNCLYLFYYEDYSIEEISGLLEMPKNTVKTNLRRGREELKKAIQSEEEDRRTGK